MNNNIFLVCCETLFKKNKIFQTISHFFYKIITIVYFQRKFFVNYIQHTTVFVF